MRQPQRAGAGTKFQQVLMNAFCFIPPKTLRTANVEAAIAQRLLRVE